MKDIDIRFSRDAAEDATVGPPLHKGRWRAPERPVPYVLFDADPPDDRMPLSERLKLWGALTAIWSACVKPDDLLKNARRRGR